MRELSVTSCFRLERVAGMFENSDVTETSLSD
jgi:hypothetical protein